MRISDWSSDVCSSDLKPNIQEAENRVMAQILLAEDDASMREFLAKALRNAGHHVVAVGDGLDAMESLDGFRADLLLADVVMPRSEEHTSELQSLIRNSYAVFCLKKTNHTYHRLTHPSTPPSP